MAAIRFPNTSDSAQAGWLWTSSSAAAPPNAAALSAGVSDTVQLPAAIRA
jgi:hypothetical protein